MSNKQSKKLFIAEYFKDKDNITQSDFFSFITDDDRDDDYNNEIEWNRKERVKNFQQAFKKENGLDIKEEDVSDIWILDFSHDYNDNLEYKIELIK